jgi:hypothetical protein
MDPRKMSSRQDNPLSHLQAPSLVVCLFASWAIIPSIRFLNSFRTSLPGSRVQTPSWSELELMRTSWFTEVRASSFPASCETGKQTDLQEACSALCKDTHKLFSGAENRRLPRLGFLRLKDGQYRNILDFLLKLFRDISNKVILQLGLADSLPVQLVLDANRERLAVGRSCIAALCSVLCNHHLIRLLHQHHQGLFDGPTNMLWQSLTENASRLLGLKSAAKTRDDCHTHRDLWLRLKCGEVLGPVFSDSDTRAAACQLPSICVGSS